jgi:hypothetical protein
MPKALYILLMFLYTMHNRIQNLPRPSILWMRSICGSTRAVFHLGGGNGPLFCCLKRAGLLQLNITPSRDCRQARMYGSLREPDDLALCDAPFFTQQRLMRAARIGRALPSPDASGPATLVVLSLAGKMRARNSCAYHFFYQRLSFFFIGAAKLNGFGLPYGSGPNHARQSSWALLPILRQVRPRIQQKSALIVAETYQFSDMCKPCRITAQRA